MILLQALLLLLGLGHLQAYKIVCYFTNWAQYRPGVGKFMPSDVDPSLCTHLIYAFAQISNNNLATFEWNDLDLYNQTMDLKKTNPNLKVLIAVGGWNAGSTAFSNMVTNDALRGQFVQQAVQFLTTHNFDGLDLDWEYPAFGMGSRSSDKTQFSKLCAELKTAFKAKKFLLTAAIAAGKSKIDAAYDVPALSQNIDFFNIMTYDYHGSWETVTGANAPLYATDSLSVSNTVEYYISKGMPASKIILGMGLYGRSWTLNSASSNGIGSPANAPGTPGQYTKESGYLAYYEICQFISQGWTRIFDNNQKIPYIYKGNQWASYDDKESLGYKVDYLKSKNLGGAMFWAVDLDDFTGTLCNSSKYPLINYIKSLIDDGLVTSPATTTKTTITTTKTSTTTKKTTTTKMPTTTTKTPTTTTTTKITTATTKTTTGAGISCPATGATSFQPIKGTNCAKFYQCSNGIVYNFDCSPGTYFDVRIGTCNHLTDFYCPSSVNQNNKRN